MGSSTSSKTQTATQTIPAEVTAANAAMLARGQKLAELGYIPYMGVDVAGINPAERAAMENVGQMASAFGLAAPAAVDIGMPEVTVSGMTGYSAFPLYEGALERFRETRPDQYEAYAEALGYDPLTGQKVAPPAPVYSGGGGSAAPAASPMIARSGGGEAYFSGGFGDAPVPSGNSLITGGPSAASRNVFATADLYGNHGGSHISKISSDVGDFVSSGGLFGAIKNAFSKKKNDPSIGNVP